MKLINPFTKKDNSEAVILDKQQKYVRENIVTESSVHPQAVDEHYAIEKNNLLAEIRRWQQDLSPKFRQAFEELAGVRINAASGMVVEVQEVKPLMSINGAYQLINYVKILDHNVMRSNYSETRINLNLRYGVGYPIIQFVKDNYRQLGIEKNFGKLNYIVNYLYNLVEPTYFHALNDGERKHDSQIYKVVRTENENTEPKKKGLWK